MTLVWSLSVFFSPGEVDFIRFIFMAGKLLKDLTVTDVIKELERRKGQLSSMLRDLILAEGNDPETHLFQVDVAEEAKSEAVVHEARVIGIRRAADPELLAAYECPICNDMVLPPLYQCLNGHLTCSTCRPKVTNCSMCRDANFNIRALVAERVLDTVWLPCRFSICSEMFRWQQKLAHENSCEQRAVDIVSLATDNGLLRVESGHVNYQLPLAAVDSTFYRRARQQFNDDVSVYLHFHRSSWVESVFVIYTFIGKEPGSIRMTATMLMKSGEKLKVVMKEVHSSGSTRSGYTMWPIADLPDTIALDVLLESV